MPAPCPWPSKTEDRPLSKEINRLREALYSAITIAALLAVLAFVGWFMR